MEKVRKWKSSRWKFREKERVKAIFNSFKSQEFEEFCSQSIYTKLPPNFLPKETILGELSFGLHPKITWRKTKLKLQFSICINGKSYFILLGKW